MVDIMRAFLLGALLATAACVGDDSTTIPPDSGTPESSTADATQPEAGADVVIDTSPPCDATACNGSCVDVGTDPANCGACGHSCGGGTCVAAQCQPYAIQTGLDSTYIAADATGLYYSSNFVIDKCALDTCKPAPTQLWDNGNGQYIDGVAVSSSNLYFLGENNNGEPAVYRCPETGCTTPTQLAGIAMNGYAGPFVYGTDVYFAPVSSNTVVKHASCSNGCSATETLTPSFSGGTLVVSDGSSIFILVQNTNAIYKCPTSGPGSCSLSSAFLTLASAPVGMGIVGTTLYIALPGASGYTNGSIKACPTSASTCNPSTLVDKLGYPQAFAVDPDGLFWWAQDETALKSCPVTGCVNGQHRVASNITTVQQLLAQSGALYWVVPGASQNTTQIMRVAY